MSFPLDDYVYLVVPLNNSNDILWSRNDIWVPSTANENSTVIIDGNYINQLVFIGQDVIINSLYLSNVVLSLDCYSITVNGFTSFIDSSIESTCDIRSKFTSFTYEFIGVTELSGINLIVLELGKLIEPQLTLVNSKVIVKEDATVIVDQSDTSSPLLAWGNGEDGKTGTGHQAEVFSVTAGKAHSLGVTRDGFLYSWGTNFVTDFGETGQLGLGDADSRMDPTKINLTNIVQASAGYGHSLVRLINGDVYSFGASLYGQLGHGNTFPNQYFPERIEFLSNVNYVSAGYAHSLAVLSNGEAKSWGYNRYGQLGISSSGFSAGKSSPHLVSLNLPSKKVVGCFEHSFFLTESGDLFATGRNDNGQLCVGDINDRNSPTPIANSKDFYVIQILGRSTSTVPSHSSGKVEGLERITGIHSSSEIVFALSVTGILYSWSGTNLPSPTTETIGLKVGKVFVGYDHFFVQDLVTSHVTGEGSFLEIEGELLINLELPLTLNTSVLVHTSGSIFSTLSEMRFEKSINNSGIVIIDGLLELDSSSVLNLSGGNVDAQDIIVYESASISGYGSIISTVFNHGTIKISGLLEIEKDLAIAQHSNVFLNYCNNEAQLIVKGILSVNGSFVFAFHKSIPSNYTISLVLFGSLLSEHGSFLVQCDHVVTTQDYPGIDPVSGQCPLPLDLNVYLVVPLNNSNDILWSRIDIWVPSPPNENSTVIIDGNYINQVVFIDQNVIIKSLYLTNVVLSLQCSSITVNGFTSFIDSSIESTCDTPSEFTSLTYDFIGVTKLSGINLIVLEFGKLIEPQLNLVNSTVIITEDAALLIDQSDIIQPNISGNEYSVVQIEGLFETRETLPLVLDTVISISSTGTLLSFSVA
ncbi:hypothetical protein GEMRC1_007352 [Eukaryota sp. GEM-RC1]